VLLKPEILENMSTEGSKLRASIIEQTEFLEEIEAELKTLDFNSLLRKRGFLL